MSESKVITVSGMIGEEVLIYEATYPTIGVHYVLTSITPLGVECVTVGTNRLTFFPLASIVKIQQVKKQK